jgi:pimeloyl-ACP methyl ester carboxylesterase
MDIVLIAGLWLPATAWDAVLPPLRALGHRPAPVALPGQGAPPSKATLEDQRAAVLAAVDAASDSVLVAGHSAAGTLAWMAADARPEKVRRVVMIGGFTCGDGQAYADFFEIADGVMPFPGWDHFDAPDTADLDDRQRQTIAATTVPVPEAVARGIVHLNDDRRYDIPVTVICPEFSASDARRWIEGGDVPELAKVRDVDYVDIDSGHWPMFTRPDQLARLLAGAADT